MAQLLQYIETCVGGLRGSVFTQHDIYIKTDHEDTEGKEDFSDRIIPHHAFICSGLLDTTPYICHAMPSLLAYPSSPDPSPILIVASCSVAPGARVVSRAIPPMKAKISREQGYSHAPKCSPAPAVKTSPSKRFQHRWLLDPDIRSMPRPIITAK